MPALRRAPVLRLRRRVTRARLRRLRGFTAATFRRLLRRLRRGFTLAANVVFRRRDRRRVAFRLRRFATLILLVLYLIFVITRTLLRLLRRGLARATFRRRELLRLLRTFRSLPLLSRARFLRLFRLRLRAVAIVPPLSFKPDEDFFAFFRLCRATAFLVDSLSHERLGPEVFLCFGDGFPSSVQNLCRQLILRFLGFPPISAR
jgi:hypothetical protein